MPKFKQTLKGFYKARVRASIPGTDLFAHYILNQKQGIASQKHSKGDDAYLAGVCKNMECPALIIGGVDNHVHLLIRQLKIITVRNFIRGLKRSSSKWAKTLNPNLALFGGQNGYGAFSVSPAHVEVLKNYIANQEEHHKDESVKDKFPCLRKKYRVPVDERYVWH